MVGRGARIFAGAVAAGVVAVLHAASPGEDVRTLDSPSYVAESAVASAVLHLIGAAPRVPPRQEARDRAAPADRHRGKAVR
ncbi:hypothetical protein [Streptomyces tremellae]|uniref:Uncharacterized protein n=1 Tax=Streptomyces tremellae TaxID=1124239 RepID=A0ABP7FMB0_9ACTN